MLFNKLTVSMTDRCNASCDICCIHCSPRGKQTLETADILRAIDEAKETGKIEELNLTGGEPLLFADQALTCAAYAAERGLRVAVFTNGFWGADEEKANRLAGALAKAGVTRLHFSADSYHQRYIPFPALARAMRAARGAGIATELALMVLNDGNDVARVQEALADEFLYAKRIVHPALPVGRAREALDESRFQRMFSPQFCPCFYEGMLHLVFDGCFYTCCSMYFRSIPRLNLGSMRDLSVAEAAAKAEADPLLFLIINGGMPWLLRRMAESGMDVPKTAHFPCEYCAFIFDHAGELPGFQEEAREKANRIKGELFHEREYSNNAPEALPG